jgi:uncharacterized membrane protein YwzB
MTDDFLLMGYLFVFLGLIPIIFKALLALNFSELFQRQSTWQIKFLLGIISVVLAFLVAFSILTTFETIRALF